MNEIYKNYLKHHGILGQKWGKRNGPPYPLGAGDHSAAEKKAGWRKSLSSTPNTSNTSNTPNSKYGLHSGKKRTLESYKDTTDHNDSDKTPLAKYMVRLALHAATLNVEGLALDGKRMVDALYASHKEKASEKRRQKLKVDKKTGFYLKDKEYTSKQDVKMINPGFRNFDLNTKNNCVLCSVAFDMRRRGYDVAANKASYGYLRESISNWYPKAKLENVQSTSRLNPGKDLRDTLLKQGDGARGCVFVRWNGTRSGHAMAYEVSGGKMHLYDGQTGKEYSYPNKILWHADRNSTQYARLDNIDFDKKKIKECVH